VFAAIILGITFFWPARSKAFSGAAWAAKPTTRSRPSTLPSSPSGSCSSSGCCWPSRPWA
jgi:hypothetical protein